MESNVIFEDKVALSPKDMMKAVNSSIDEIIMDKMKSKLEGKCSSSGWVVPDTLKLISRSMCQNMPGQFTGAMISWVQAEGKVIYPTDGMVVTGVVSKKNKMGMFVDYKNAMQIMVPRDLHLGNMRFDGIRIGDSVSVTIKKSKYQINDEYILSVGILEAAAEAVDEVAVEVVPELEETEEAAEAVPELEELEELEEAVEAVPELEEAEEAAETDEAVETEEPEYLNVLEEQESPEKIQVV